MNDDPRAFIPITESSYFILLSLASGKKHGYAIMKDVELLSQDDLSLSASTLYTALGRLLDQNLIERITDHADVGQRPGLPRKVYGLTQLGRRVLEVEIARLEKMILATHLRLSQGFK